MLANITLRFLVSIVTEVYTSLVPIATDDVSLSGVKKKNVNFRWIIRFKYRFEIIRRLK